MKLKFDDDVTITKEEHVALVADRMRYRWLARQFAKANHVTLADAAEIIDAIIIKDWRRRAARAERNKKGLNGQNR